MWIARALLETVDDAVIVTIESIVGGRALVTHVREAIAIGVGFAFVRNAIRLAIRNRHIADVGNPISVAVGLGTGSDVDRHDEDPVFDGIQRRHLRLVISIDVGPLNLREESPRE